MTEKVGLFGGTFDPIHFGHLNLATQLLESQKLDRILFCPALVSPTKTKTPPLSSAKHRLNMLMLATEEVPAFVPFDEELSRPAPSYTIDTVSHLVKEGRELYLILSEDSAYTFDQWKEPEKLLTLATPLIGTRSGFDKEKLNHMPAELKTKLEQGMRQTSLMDISSTTIRERLKKRLYCGHLVPGKVLDYIYQNGLYYVS